MAPSGADYHGTATVSYSSAYVAAYSDGVTVTASGPRPVITINGSSGSNYTVAVAEPPIVKFFTADKWLLKQRWGYVTRAHKRKTLGIRPMVRTNVRHNKPCLTYKQKRRNYLNG